MPNRVGRVRCEPEISAGTVGMRTAIGSWNMNVAVNKL